MIPVSKPWMDEKEAEAARRAILSGWITLGPEVGAFEEEFARAVGARHACAVSSGTTALHLALEAAGVGPGDEVVTVSYSFIATANSIRYCGATPVFVDIDPQTFNIDPERITAAITPRTRAILAVHQMGMPCDLAAIVPLARAHKLALIEDAACAAGSEILWEGAWQRIGRPQGDAATFSFHPRKVLSTGDGGMITTNRPEWDQRFRLTRHHGMNVPAHTRHVSAQVIWESYETLGYNYRLTDIQGAIGREQLRRLDAMVQRRRELAQRYDGLLAGVAGVAAPVEPEWARSNWQSYCIRLTSGQDQRAVMQKMLESGVATRRGVMCAHREPAYPPETWGGDRVLRHSEHAHDHTVILPLYQQMTDAEQDRVVKALRDAGAC